MDLKGEKIGAVLVVGGGIGGIQAALDLGEQGFKVYLLEKVPSVGGRMAQLDKTFPTNDCAMCILAPKLVEAARHPNIQIITQAEIKSIKGEAGRFSISLIKYPRYVDEEKCTGCGTCIDKCPAKVKLLHAKDEFDFGLKERKAIYTLYPQAVPNIPTIDFKNCIYFIKGKCGVCKKVCPSGAIDFEQTQEAIEIEAGAIILACGFDIFDADLRSEYGYKRYQNVVTSLEFERILSASGPFQGHLQRLSDKREPNSIAFIQCVGSRDIKLEKGYCSAVCCTYAIKEAIIAKEHLKKELSISIFGMDIRTYGKGFEEYYNRAKEEYGVRFIRSRVSEITEIRPTKSLRLHYETEDGEINAEEFDMVVLSVGIKVKNAKELAQIFGITLNESDFCKTSELKPSETSRAGIFLCGPIQEPKDIPETVIQASAAAGRAAELLTEARGTLVKVREYVKERDVSYLPIRIGVFVCHCGINIGGVIDVASVVEYAKTLPFVVYAEENLYTCSQDTQNRIKTLIDEYNLTRVVVAACTPRTHEPLFQQTLKEGGLNPYLFEMVNIREQCSWVHQKEQEEATIKAKELIRMACTKVVKLSPLYRQKIPVIPKALVIGGGLAGMTAALLLAKQHFQTYLVEKEEYLGGNLKHIYYTLETEDIQSYLNLLISEVTENNLIKLYLNTKILNIEGAVGNYKTTLQTDGKIETIEHGIVIIATGAQELKPTEYLFGQDERIITQLEFERLLAENTTSKKLEKGSQKISNLSSIVMIQCVGSREEGRPYCSRICCQQAIKNALKIKKINPRTEVYILYRDIRTYGFYEEYYQKAREAGIIFIHYNEEKKPEVRIQGTEEKSQLEVKVFEPLLKKELIITPDLIVLSPAITPNNDNTYLSKLLKVPLDNNGFFLEAHIKLRPVECATEGVFLAGLCHAPKNIKESILQAEAAVSRSVTLLSKSHIEAEAQIAKVDIQRCNGCGLCQSLCAYKAIEVITIDEKKGIKKAKVNEGLCKGCGLCAASCRPSAISLLGFSDPILSTLSAL